PREKEVFMMLAQGRSRAYISEDLILSEGTIKTHISHIYTKLGVSNRQEMFDVLLEDDHKN
ncbi:MAG: helix-turn-helix transcriptional regulator, partial [Raoultibacter sp.]